MIIDWCSGCIEYAKSIIEEDIDPKHDWSEHYRGTSYKIYKKAPKEIIEQQLNDAKNSELFYKNFVKMLKQQLLDLKDK